MPHIPEPHAEKIFATALGNDPDGIFSHENVDRLRELGLIQRGAQEDFTLREAVGITTELGALDPSLALLLQFHYSYLNDLKKSDWPEDLKDRVLQSVENNGDLVNTFATEPKLGQPLLGGRPATTIRPDDHGRYLLNGHKIYSTGIDAVRWIFVFVAVDDGGGDIATVVIDRTAATDGIEIERTWDSLGLRSTRSDDLLFHDVVVEPDSVVGRAQINDFDLLKPSGNQPGWFHLLIPSLYQGQTLAALRWYREFVNDRVPANLNAPLSSLPSVQVTAGSLRGLVEANNAWLSLALELAEQQPSESRTWWVSQLARVHITGNAEEIVRTIVENSGNRGLTKGSPLEFYFRNIAHSKFHASNDSTTFRLAGQDVLGID